MTLNLPLLYFVWTEEYCQTSPNKNKTPNLWHITSILVCCIFDYIYSWKNPLKKRLDWKIRYLGTTFSFIYKVRPKNMGHRITLFLENSDIILGVAKCDNFEFIFNHEMKWFNKPLECKVETLKTILWILCLFLRKSLSLWLKCLDVSIKLIQFHRLKFLIYQIYFPLNK